MNPPGNRSSESTRRPKNQPPNPSEPPTQPETAQPSLIETASPSTPIDATETTLAVQERQQPIPPPSNLRQYRAIGLVRGQYQPSEGQLTRGVLLTLDGAALDAVLLGRVISLVKKHLDLQRSHLWVVYPRTRKENDDLHVQIVGVWEPETLSRTELPPSEFLGEATTSQPEDQIQDGYFSVRGEVIYYSQEQEMVIVKIRQSPKKELEKPKFFNLKLKGNLPDQPVNHFWDLEVQLQGNTLVLQEATDLGLLPRKKKPFAKKGDKKFPSKRGGATDVSDSSGTFPTKKAAEGKPLVNRPPLPKPIKRRNPENQ
mgnify:CR=1 FL=1